MTATRNGQKLAEKCQHYSLTQRSTHLIIYDIIDIYLLFPACDMIGGDKVFAEPLGTSE